MGVFFGRLGEILGVLVPSSDQLEPISRKGCVPEGPGGEVSMSLGISVGTIFGTCSCFVGVVFGALFWKHFWAPFWRSRAEKGGFGGMPDVRFV